MNLSVKAALALGLLSLLLAFQNCDTLVNHSAATAADSGGEGYTGKVYVNRVVSGACPDGLLYESELHLISSSKALLVRTACAPVLSPSQVSITFSTAAPLVVLFDAKRFLALTTLDQAVPLPLNIPAFAFAIATEGILCDTNDCWYMNRNGYLRQNVAVASTGTYLLTVQARADLALGVGANMDIQVDGVSVGNVMVSSTTVAPYTMNLNLTAGTHQVSIGFTNDYIDNSQNIDRNLLLFNISLAQ